MKALADKQRQDQDADGGDLAAMSPGDRAAALCAMSPNDRAATLAVMKPKARAAALAVVKFCGMSPEDRAAALAAMSPEDRAAALCAMSPDDRAATLAVMKPKARTAALADIKLCGEDKAASLLGAASQAVVLEEELSEVLGVAAKADLKGEGISDHLKQVIVKCESAEELLRQVGNEEAVMKVEYVGKLARAMMGAGAASADASSSGDDSGVPTPTLLTVITDPLALAEFIANLAKNAEILAEKLKCVTDKVKLAALGGIENGQLLATLVDEAAAQLTKTAGMFAMGKQPSVAEHIMSFTKLAQQVSEKGLQEESLQLEKIADMLRKVAEGTVTKEDIDKIPKLALPPKPEMEEEAKMLTQKQNIVVTELENNKEELMAQAKELEETKSGLLRQANKVMRGNERQRKKNHELEKLLALYTAGHGYDEMNRLISVYRQKLQTLHERAQMLHPKETFNWYHEMKVKKREKDQADSQARATTKMVKSGGAKIPDSPAVGKLKAALAEFAGHLEHLKTVKQEAHQYHVQHIKPALNAETEEQAKHNAEVADTTIAATSSANATTDEVNS